MADFWVEMMKEDNTRVHPEWIRVLLRLVGQSIRVDMLVNTCEKDPISDRCNRQKEGGNMGKGE